MQELLPEIPGTPRKWILPRNFAVLLAASYMALFIIRPWEFLFPVLASIHFERICAILVIIGVAITSGFRLRLNIQNVAVIVFLGVTALSTAFAFDPSSSRDRLYVVFTLVICYLVLVSVCKSPYDLIFLIMAYVSIMELYLVKALWEYFIHGRHSYRMNVTRLIGIEDSFGGPNALAGSIVLSLPFWLFLWRKRHQVSMTWPRKMQRLYSIALVLYAALAIVSIALTNSRTGMVNLCVFVLLMSLGSGSVIRKLKRMLLAALILAIAWLALPNEQRGRMSTIWDSDADESATASADGRIYGFKAGLAMLKRFPLLGVGPGSFIAYRVQYLDGTPLVAHNLAGQMLGGTGIVGLIGFSFIVIAPLVNRRRLRKLSQSCDDNTVQTLAELGTACRNVIILLFIDGLAGDNLYRFNWLWLGAFCSIALEYAKAIYSAQQSNSPDEQ